MGLCAVCSGIVWWMLGNLIGNNGLVIGSSFFNMCMPTNRNIRPPKNISCETEPGLCALSTLFSLLTFGIKVKLLIKMDFENWQIELFQVIKGHNLDFEKFQQKLNQCAVVLENADWLHFYMNCSPSELNPIESSLHPILVERKEMFFSLVLAFYEDLFGSYKRPATTSCCFFPVLALFLWWTQWAVKWRPLD